MRRILAFTVLTLLSCGQEERADRRTYRNNNPELEDLKKRVEQLELLSAVFEDINDRATFSDCDDPTITNQLFKSICTIAQTATQEQLSALQHQFGQFAKQYQEAIYGPNCSPSGLPPGAEPGTPTCPSPTSLSGRLEDLEASQGSFQSQIDDLATDVGTLQGQVSSIQAALAAAENDIDDLQDADIIINNLIDALDLRLDAVEADIASIEGRLDDLEEIVDPDVILRPIELCGTIVGAGPIYEIVQLTSSYKKMYGMRGNGSNRNLARLLSNTSLTAPADGQSLVNNNSYRYTITTSVGSSTCNAIAVRRWNGSQGLQICWHATNWNHSHNNLVNLYNQVGRPNITCVGDVQGGY